MTDSMRDLTPPRQRVPHEDWDRAPWNRWTFQNVRQMTPTTEVWRGNGPVRKFEYNLQDIDEVEFNDAGSNTTDLLTWVD